MHRHRVSISFQMFSEISEIKSFAIAAGDSIIVSRCNRPERAALRDFTRGIDPAKLSLNYLCQNFNVFLHKNTDICLRDAIIWYIPGLKFFSYFRSLSIPLYLQIPKGIPR